MPKKARYHRLMLVLGLILGLAGVILIGFTSFESHQVRQQLQQTQAVKSQQTQAVKSQQKRVVKQQERQLNAVSVKSPPAHAQLNDAVTRLVQAMYTFKDGQSYVANRKAVLPLIDSAKLPDKQLNQVYATGLDADGQKHD